MTLHSSMTTEPSLTPPPARGWSSGPAGVSLEELTAMQTPLKRAPGSIPYQRECRKKTFFCQTTKETFPPSLLPPSLPPSLLPPSLLLSASMRCCTSPSFEPQSRWMPRTIHGRYTPTISSPPNQNRAGLLHKRHSHSAFHSLIADGWKHYI